jgi:DNA repair protein RecO (recombination protein O)
MGLVKTPAVVVGRHALGESDRLVTFYTREFGKVRGVARAARRARSRFGSALELFTLGELIGFDTGRSDLLRIDHFDIARPFDRIREDLVRLGQASWMLECLGRLTAEQDRHRALYGLLVRSLRAVEESSRPSQVSICFGVRCVDLVGHRLRLDRCVGCDRPYPFPNAHLDVDGGGLVCEPCGRAAGAALPISAATVDVLGRLRSLTWAQAQAVPLGAAEAEITAILDAQVSRLAGRPTRTPRFLRAIARVSSAEAPRAATAGESL